MQFFLNTSFDVVLFFKKTFELAMTFFSNAHVKYLVFDHETFYGLKAHYESILFLKFIHKF